MTHLVVCPRCRGKSIRTTDDLPMMGCALCRGEGRVPATLHDRYFLAVEKFSRDGKLGATYVASLRQGYINSLTTVDVEVKHVKLLRGDRVYYIRENLMTHVAKRLAQWPSSEIGLVQFADFVIDRRSNELIKCRDSLENLFDKYLEPK